MAVISAGYFSIDSAGGSGYLGAFLAGLIVGNMEQLGLAMHSEHERDMRVLVATVSEVMVMFVFITLGANIPWGEIQAEFGPALLVVGSLILVARPLTVLACLLRTGEDRGRAKSSCSWPGHVRPASYQPHSRESWSVSMSRRQT